MGCLDSAPIDLRTARVVLCSRAAQARPSGFVQLCGPQEVQEISASEFRVNERIRVPEVRLIDADGENKGVVPIEDARATAETAGLDLVEVAPNAEPPVVRVLDFGKFLYEKAKKDREARKAQTKVEVKEIRLRPKTSEHHRSFKVKNARRWLEEGKKVLARIRFRGREITYPEIALEDLRQIAEELEDVGMIEQAPRMEGRTMFMVLTPLKK
jgi:translation initiation factor IF-3